MKQGRAATQKRAGTRQWELRRWDHLAWILLLGVLLLLPGWPAAQAETTPAAPATPPVAEHAVEHEALIKDVSSVNGVRDNQLIGYGIVVGLQNTGDSQMTYFPLQTLLSTLQRLGIVVPYPLTTIMVKNMAAVFVEATLPPFIQPGGKIDVTVSSTGDARSLTGGVLLLTPLYGPDGQIYAEAQGPLVVGGYSIAANGNARQVNFPDTARIPEGGIVERAVPFSLASMRTLTMELHDADFETAIGMADTINQALGRKAAHALDSRQVRLDVAQGEDVPMLLARVQALPVHVYPRAKVVVNERTGTVVIGGNVRLLPVSILHGGLAIDVVTEFQVSQPNAFGAGTTEVVPQTQVQATNQPVNRIQLKQGATVDDLVRNLQAIGATATDVISILQAMKQAGALEADLVVI
ncbi:MAG: flagellar basal body P-ring protein FlgI [Acidobacteriaceae bacterium]